MLNIIIFLHNALFSDEAVSSEERVLPTGVASLYTSYSEKY